MGYYLDLFSPETYEAFGRSNRTISGFRASQRNAAFKIGVGDKFICYMTKLSRWVGLLEVTSEPFEDDSPIFYPANDPFVVRFRVRTLVWLDKEKAIPIHDVRLWDSLSFTQGHNRGSSTWTGKLRISLRQIDDSDGQLLEKMIRDQAREGEVFEIDEREYQKLVSHQIRRHDKVVSVSVPEDSDRDIGDSDQDLVEVRESIKIQALIASIGAQMGMKIWLPRSDRAAVLKEWNEPDPPILDFLPLNYDETTLKTIEQIDVLWLKGRSIVRAFEVEHTTSILLWNPAHGRFAGSVVSGS